MSSIFDQKFEQKFQERTDSYNRKTYGTQYKPNNSSRFYQNTGSDRPSIRRCNSHMRNYSNPYPHNEGVNHKHDSSTNTNYNSQSRYQQNMTQENSYEKPNLTLRAFVMLKNALNQGIRSDWG
jgi:hypothetical protein